ncbi:hypothetical protein L195_g032825 [Trifolium pratense]|uniref:Uncharacterized protein n=1 Tax=Trifolium pratense TaxID=57577 RepID=A0A2K3LEB4_TRIPR|nr:hypothetical protein L195_g032825 [Trifolium pratense]
MGSMLLTVGLGFTPPQHRMVGEVPMEGLKGGRSLCSEVIVAGWGKIISSIVVATGGRVKKFITSRAKSQFCTQKSQGFEKYMCRGFTFTVEVLELFLVSN